MTTKIENVRRLEKVGAIWLNKSKFREGNYLSLQLNGKKYYLDDFGTVQKNNRPNYRSRNGNLAGWLKRGKKDVFISLSVKLDGSERRLLAFKNTYKKTDKQPDYIVYQ